MHKLAGMENINFFQQYFKICADFPSGKLKNFDLSKWSLLPHSFLLNTKQKPDECLKGVENEV